jgi:hypothetical protein
VELKKVWRSVATRRCFVYICSEPDLEGYALKIAEDPMKEAIGNLKALWKNERIESKGHPLLKQIQDKDIDWIEVVTELKKLLPPKEAV